MKKKFKLHLIVSILAMSLMGCKTSQLSSSTSISLINNSDLELSDKAVTIKRSLIDTKGIRADFPVLIYKNDTIPTQVNDLDGNGKWDELFVVTNFSAKETKNIQLKWMKVMPKFKVRTSVRFGKRESKNEPVHPATEETLLANQVHKKLGYEKYQTDGPTWENDKVGFRHYLDGRNAKDVFGKKIPAITPENVGINSMGAVEDNYHVMYDWGRDIFPVGNSAGLGGLALLVGDEINRLGIINNDTINNIEKTTFKIVSEGTENSVLSYKYHNWRASGNLYQLNETTSIWPGMYGYKNTVSLEGQKGNEMLLIALSNINNQNPLNVVEAGNFICLIQHDKLSYKREWIMGTAIIVPKKGYNGYMEAPKTGQLINSYLAKFKLDDKEPISYYAIATWELSADKNFKDSAYFNAYVVNLAKQLSTDIKVEINN
jgi:hypothetical protein